MENWQENQPGFTRKYFKENILNRVNIFTLAKEIVCIEMQYNDILTHIGFVSLDR